mgnify:CR=1 FL=1
MEEEKTTDVKENLVNFAVKNIYGDLAQPATREIGNAVSSLIKFVALPFSFLGMTADQLKERYREFLTDTISKVPPEKMCNPSANIVAPLLDHVKFVFDEIGISERYVSRVVEILDTLNIIKYIPMKRRKYTSNGEEKFITGSSR